MIKIKTSLWQKFRQFTDNHRVLAICIVVGFFLIGVGLIIAGFALQPQAKVVKKPAPEAVQAMPEPTPQAFYSPMTGVKVPDEATTKRQVTAIMLENSMDARPQSGLKDAGVVFEAIAEGGITRFLTLHQEDRPQMIGPVRSLRPYYVDWLAPFDAAVAHVGGSLSALNEIRNGSYKDIDQFFNGKYYWRATDRYAPHNVYTSFDKLDELNAAKGFKSSSFTGFARKLDSPAAAPNASKINVAISSAAFNSSYTYNPATNSYDRSEGGAPHNDREAGRISPKVAIVIKVQMKMGFEDGYREQITTTGHNTAYIFQDGMVIEGFWNKPDKKSQMRFYDKTGHQIALNAGQTWITAIPQEKSVTWQ